MSDAFLIWKYQSVPHACVLQDLRGLEETFRLMEGVPMLAGYPSDVQFHMNPDFPDDLLLVDNSLNSDLCIVASGRLQQALRKRELAKVEYLPVAIIDHKGGTAANDYCIVHPLEPVDCVDRAQSVFKVSRIEPDRIDRFKKLVIDAARVPKDRYIFRLKGFWDIVVVRAELAAELDKEKFTGLGWLPIEKYPEK